MERAYTVKEVDRIRAAINKDINYPTHYRGQPGYWGYGSNGDWKLQEIASKQAATVQLEEMIRTYLTAGVSAFEVECEVDISIANKQAIIDQQRSDYEKRERDQAVNTCWSKS